MTMRKANSVSDTTKREMCKCMFLVRLRWTARESPVAESWGIEGSFVANLYSKNHQVGASMS